MMQHGGDECAAYVPVGKGVKFFIYLDDSDDFRVGITTMYSGRDWLDDIVKMGADIAFVDQDSNGYGRVDFVLKNIHKSDGHHVYGFPIEHFEDSKRKQIEELYEKAINLFDELEIYSIRYDYLENIKDVEKLAKEYEKFGTGFKKIIEEYEKKDK